MSKQKPHKSKRKTYGNNSVMRSKAIDYQNCQNPKQQTHLLQVKNTYKYNYYVGNFERPLWQVIDFLASNINN